MSQLHHAAHAAFAVRYMGLAVCLACLLPWVKLPRLLAAIEARKGSASVDGETGKVDGATGATLAAGAADAAEADASVGATGTVIQAEIALIDRIARWKFFVIRNNCLKKSLLFYHYLLQSGVRGVAIHLGVDKRGGKLAGHCWLTLNGQVFQDTELFVSNYTVIYTSGE